MQSLQCIQHEQQCQRLTYKSFNYDLVIASSYPDSCQLDDLQVAEMKRKFPRFAASAIDDVEVDTLPWQTAGAAPQEAVEQLPEAGPSRPICDTIGPSTRKSHCLCQHGSDGCASKSSSNKVLRRSLCPPCLWPPPPGQVMHHMVRLLKNSLKDSFWHS